MGRQPLPAAARALTRQPVHDAAVRATSVAAAPAIAEAVAPYTMSITVICKFQFRSVA
jgi:hypothetical protein